jgi:hypothetical protein
VAHPVLWQFRLSHYNEKARWALDYKGIPHERRSLLLPPAGGRDAHGAEEAAGPRPDGKVIPI